MPQKKIYIETFGCQMNLADSEVALSILHQRDFGISDTPETADVILVNTCSIREHAEQRVHQRIQSLKRYKRENPGVVIGVLGCMAERLRVELIEKGDIVDLVVGPDEYRKLPTLVDNAIRGQKGIAVKLSRMENYDDILPFRTDGISAWLPVMRGCDKFCSFCVVPFTRGRERSRALKSILREVKHLSQSGYKEVTLLGQNVNSYQDGDYDFTDLMREVSAVDRSMRLRFTTSHPQDMSEKLIRTIAEHQNICKYIHLPVQSGSNRILELMNRSYTIEDYLRLVDTIRTFIPGIALSTDIIAGFPGETDDDHQQTISVLNRVNFDGAFMFKYSARENTKAWEMGDTVPDEVKTSRLNEIIELQQTISLQRNRPLIGQIVDVLVERESTKSSSDWMGRTDTNKTVIFPKEHIAVGQTVRVKIDKCNSATLFGSPCDVTSESKPYRIAVNQ